MDEHVHTIERHGASYLIEADPAGRIGGVLARGAPYEAQLLDEIYERTRDRAVRPGWALDVGAHVGNHSLFLAAVCGLRVIAMEPQEEAYRLLVHNIGLNEALTGRILPYRMAAGAKPGRGVITDRMELVMVATNDPGAVEVIPVDTLLEGVPDEEHLYVVKVDVEGTEPDVLTGAQATLERWRPMVYAESHSADASREQQRVLEPLGYRFGGELRMGSTMVRWEPQEGTLP